MRERHDDGDPETEDAGPTQARGSAQRTRARGVLERDKQPEDKPRAPVEQGIRPRRFADYIGQTQLKRKLGVFVQAARQRAEPLDHTLLHGPPGLGKTTMAHILAAELEVDIHVTSGPAIEHKGVLAGHLTTLRDRDVLFIDEIHRLTPTVEESLYSAMEDRRIDIPVGEGTSARTMNFDLAPFTLIGATTRTALLSGPLRDRFQIIEGIEFSQDDELAALVQRTAEILGCPVGEESAIEIGRRSRGTPRIANRLTRRVRDFVQVAGYSTIEFELASRALDELGIDREGLDSLDRRILGMILEQFSGGPVGIEALAASLGEPRDTLEGVYEPFLLQRGFVIRTHRGRMATAKAAKHLGKKLPKQAQRGGQLEL
jgi:Holliday junction DNA helicase RuvB